MRIRAISRFVIFTDITATKKRPKQFSFTTDIILVQNTGNNNPEKLIVRIDAQNFLKVVEKLPYIRIRVSIV